MTTANQDPAEGSRAVIERELRRSAGRDGKDKSEAAEDRKKPEPPSKAPN